MRFRGLLRFLRPGVFLPLGVENDVLVRHDEGIVFLVGNSASIYGRVPAREGETVLNQRAGPNNGNSVAGFVIMGLRRFSAGVAVAVVGDR